MITFRIHESDRVQYIVPFCHQTIRLPLITVEVEDCVFINSIEVYLTVPKYVALNTYIIQYIIGYLAVLLYTIDI